MKKKSQIGILFGIIVVVALLTVLLSVWTNKKHRETFENDVKVALFHATWCGHCVKYLASGNFEKAEKKVQGSNSNVEFVKYDYDKNKDLAEKYNVSSFPTIIGLVGEKTYKFYGDRNNVNHIQFFIEKAIEGKSLDSADYE